MCIDSILLTSGLNFSFVFMHEPTRDFNSAEYYYGNGLNAPLTIFIARKCKLGASKGGF
jgi:hypothetical protein